MKTSSGWARAGRFIIRTRPMSHGASSRISCASSTPQRPVDRSSGNRQIVGPGTQLALSWILRTTTVSALALDWRADSLALHRLDPDGWLVQSSTDTNPIQSPAAQRRAESATLKLPSPRPGSLAPSLAKPCPLDTRLLMGGTFQACCVTRDIHGVARSGTGRSTKSGIFILSSLCVTHRRLPPVNASGSFMPKMFSRRRRSTVTRKGTGDGRADARTNSCLPPGSRSSSTTVSSDAHDVGIPASTK